MHTIELDTPSSTLSLYARAATGKKSGQLTGDSLPPLSVTLKDVQADPKKLAQYRSVCGFTKDLCMPATYPHILAFPLHMELLVSKAFPFPLLGLVHVRNEFTQYRAIGNQEILDIECSLEGPTTVSKGMEFDIVTKVFAAGNLVWESTSTNLYRCKTDVDEQKKSSSAEFSADTVLHWSAQENIGRRYAKVSGDSNLIHLYAFTAKLFGFKRAIAHGMWSKASAIAALDQYLPIGPFKVSVAFKLPVFLPASVQFQFTETNGNVEFHVKDSDGVKPHLAGTLTPLK
ncbi:hypothetical protein A9Q99_18630 [Gammaproteobacteria bacterium 45_16_T64]|nr:hypothetical protein A9Q99_18630 [Gammaproteobacteria bacterium 45_16_T64]